MNRLIRATAAALTAGALTAGALTAGAVTVGALAGGSLVVLVVSGAVAPARVSAQSDADRERARSEFDRGVTLYAAENFQGALEAFQEAFRLRPHPTVRVNMANCYDRLNKPIEAIFYFERYLSESGRGAPAAQRRDVDEALRRLRARVGQLTLRVLPDGATVVIDDGDSRRTPILEPIRLTAGTHRLETRLAGFRLDRRTVEVPGGGEVDVQVTLSRETGAVAVARPPPNGGVGVATRPPPNGGVGVATRPPPQNVEPPVQPQPEPHRQPIVTEPLPPPVIDPGPEDDSGGLVITMPTIVVGAASGALVLTAIIVGAMASGANSEFDDLAALSNDPSLSVAERSLIRRDAVDTADRATALALVADVLGVAGLVGLGVTALLFITSQGGSSDRAAAARGPRLGVAPTFSRDGAGVSLQGSF